MLLTQSSTKYCLTLKNKLCTRYFQPTIDKAKLTMYMKKAVKSAAEYNSMFMREKREERRAYFDLQTNVSIFPSEYYFESHMFSYVVQIEALHKYCFFLCHCLDMFRTYMKGLNRNILCKYRIWEITGIRLNSVTDCMKIIWTGHDNKILETDIRDTYIESYNEEKCNKLK